MTIDVARLRELHQPMYGHTGDPCSWCREWTPCPVTELLDAYEERDHLRALLERASTFVITAPWSTERVDLLADIDAALGGRECAIDEILRLRAALRQVTRRRTAWLSIGAINNVAEIRVERELFEEWVRLIPALEGRK